MAISISRYEMLLQALTKARVLVKCTDLLVEL